MLDLHEGVVELFDEAQRKLRQWVGGGGEGSFSFRGQASSWAWRLPKWKDEAARDRRIDAQLRAQRRARLVAQAVGEIDWSAIEAKAKTICWPKKKPPRGKRLRGEAIPVAVSSTDALGPSWWWKRLR